MEGGETVIITRRGEPVAELRPPAETIRRDRLSAPLRGKWNISEEEIERVFIGPDEEFARHFYGEDYDAVVEASEQFRRERDAQEKT